MRFRRHLWGLWGTWVPLLFPHCDTHSRHTPRPASGRHWQPPTRRVASGSREMKEPLDFPSHTIQFGKTVGKSTVQTFSTGSFPLGLSGRHPAAISHWGTQVTQWTPKPPLEAREGNPLWCPWNVKAVLLHSTRLSFLDERRERC